MILSSCPRNRQQAKALIEKYNTGLAQPNLSAGNVGGVAIPLPPIEVQETIVAEIEAEQALVNGNRDLIARFEKKIDAAIARVWGEAKGEVAS